MGVVGDSFEWPAALGDAAGRSAALGRGAGAPPRAGLAAHDREVLREPLPRVPGDREALPQARGLAWIAGAVLRDGAGRVPRPRLLDRNPQASGDPRVRGRREGRGSRLRPVALQRVRDLLANDLHCDPRSEDPCDLVYVDALGPIPDFSEVPAGYSTEYARSLSDELPVLISDSESESQSVERHVT